MVYSCAYWAAAGRHPGGRPARQARPRLPQARPDARARGSSTSAAAGAPWPCTPPASTACSVVGITLSQEQAAYARKRVAEEGLTDRVEIRVQDYRDVTDGPYDAISSIGMAEHVGADRYLEYAEDLYAPAQARRAAAQPPDRPARRSATRRRTPSTSSSTRYVFPDGELAPVGTTVAQLEAPGSRSATWSRSASTTPSPCARWVANLEARLGARRSRLAGPGRARVWRLYMAASALAFERNRIGVNQVLAVRPPEGGCLRAAAAGPDWGACDRTEA